MEKSRHFTELIVWQKAHQFVLNVYILTRHFPREETYGLVSQFRRASISIGANIAEGYSKKGLRDKIRFLNIAQGSLTECEYYLRLTKDLKYAEAKHMNVIWMKSADSLTLIHELSKRILNSPTPNSYFS